MPVLSYSLTLPQNLYPALDRPFSVFRSLVNDYVRSLWNEKGFSILSDKGSACGILKKHFPKPEGIPSRLYRNALEMAGQVIRSQIERKKLFDTLLSGQTVKASPLFVEKVRRQIEKAKKKGKELNYFSLTEPTFSGNSLITSADDSLKGQLKRLSFERKGSLWLMSFEVKVPYPEGWKWLKVRKVCPDRRKEILEVFTDLVVEHAVAYACTHIAIEDLSFNGVPEWKSSKAIRRFSQWFYSKVEEKLRYKAQLKGIELLKVNPAYTSSVCHKCGSRVEKGGLFVKCSCGRYDRDYNASVNIGMRALQVCHAKARDQRLRAIPGRILFRQGMAGWRALLAVIPLLKLLAWLKVVYTSYLRAQNTCEWIGLDKYSQEKWNGK